MSDYRGPPPSPMSRNSRERSMERSYHPSPRYDDRRGPPPMRDARYDPREERYPPGPPPSRDHRGPPPGPPQGPPQIGPTMPMKPSQSTYEAPPMPPSQPPPQPQGHDPSYGYGHQYPDPNAQYPHGIATRPEITKLGNPNFPSLKSSCPLAPYPTDPNAQAQAYYGQYPQDPSVIGMNGYGAPAPVPPQGQYPYTSAPAQQYQGWADPNAQSYLNTLPLQVMSFGSRDMGRHTSVPLPT
ncbi:hypothetical protein BC938DRAFT_478753 [Jimgerdemannia flammicorona]|uniref:Uncharacterized protein n=1 Tax=Jimgerdemannia flammicorona TaxID=994334 RepID=A0A433P4U0_9FUNG|nr:hypothetical protein BC938DRAFT_478753 [Jimgerdemannia flammicorona]